MSAPHAGASGAAPARRKLFVTTALPYANGPFHIGHIMEYIQADIWVRFQRMQGHDVSFVGADDAHGAAIMLRAESEGITPQELVARIAATRPKHLDGFHISFDHWHSTDSPENVELSQDIYRRLAADGLIYAKPVERFYDPVKAMFLADRYVKGKCPKCGAADQYGDACENCSTTYAPTDLIDPYSTLTGARPELRQSEHLFFQLSAPRIVAFLKRWTAAPAPGQALQPEVLNKIREWLGGDDGANKLADWDISRDAPYFGIPIPDHPGKYFYVWLDAPIGYLASLKAHLAARGVDFAAFLQDPAVEQYHFIGKDIVYFHTLFWPAMLEFAGKPYRAPDNVFVHGFITFLNEKMSKSRGTGISPDVYLDLGLNPEWLRYYIAAKLNAKVEDLDFNPDDFLARVNSDLIGKYVNIASRAAPFLTKHFEGRLAPAAPAGSAPAIPESRDARRRRRRRLREPRVRPRAAAGDGLCRRRQRVLRRAQAVGARQGSGAARRAAARLQRVRRRLLADDDLPQARAAEARAGRRSVARHARPRLERPRLGTGQARPPARARQRLPAPDGADRREADRGADRRAEDRFGGSDRLLRGDGGRQGAGRGAGRGAGAGPGAPAGTARARRRRPRRRRPPTARSPSTISPASTCASRGSSTPSTCPAPTSC